MDAARIVSTLIMQEKTESLDFFTFAEDWISKNSLKSTKNYKCTLSALESYLGVRKLDFSQINYTLLKNFELYLSDRPRAKSMYLGYMRHLYREAMLEYNTDEATVIKNDPFMRYKAPKQVLKKGVRALSVQDILKVYHYKGIDPKGRPQPVRAAVATAAISMMFFIFIIELLCHLLNSIMALTSLPIDRETMMPSAVL